jgi:hypothetical protein
VVVVKVMAITVTVRTERVVEGKARVIEFGWMRV